MNNEPSLNNNRNNVNNNVNNNNNNIDYDLYRWFHSGTNNSNNSINNPAHVPNMSRLSLSNYNNIHTNPLEVDEFPLMFLRNQTITNNNINNNNNTNNTRNDNMNATTNLMMMLNNNNSTNNANNANNNNSNNSYNIGVNNSNNNSNGSSSRIYPFLLNNNNTTNNNNQHSTNNNNNNNNNNNSNNNNNNSAMSSGTSFTYNAIQSICANVSAAPPFLEDVIVCVNHSDVHWDSSRKNDVTKCCKNLGAKIMKTKNVISSDAILTGQTIVLFITMFKSGEEYEKMLHYGNKNVCIMSPYFLNFLISFYSQPRVQMTSMNRPSRRQHSQPHNHFGLLQMPRFDNCHPLFAPLPSRDGIPHMKDFVISVTGFIGSERSDLKFLIRAVGAKYSGALSKKENTHLICCNAEGEKWRKAKEWKIKVVNFRWLWDCVAQWSYIDESAYQDVLVVR